ncbi:D-galactarate dehydratase / Altronate hydrolase, C terminus [Alistipes sp. cv1]|nr:D-galactarate dehydratase / Altronate hydrolase, C terminus [Faecalibacterium prausnitzii]
MIADGEKTIDEAAKDLLDLVIRVASGEQTKAEKHGFRVFMAMTTRMMIYAFLLYGGIFAAIVAVIARVIKYLIRYGIDYYFEKLAQNQKHKED